MARAPRFSNVRSLEERINAIGKNTGVELMRALRQSAQVIQNKALEMMEEPKTGRIYTHYMYTDAQGRLRQGRRRPVPHQASAPGEAPARDSGRLSQSLTTEEVATGPEHFEVNTGSNVPYATELELGSRKIAPRPFMGPAFDETREANVTRIRNAIIRGTR